MWSSSIFARRDRRLHGRSEVYEKVSIPVESLKVLRLGDFERYRMSAEFQECVVRPAREPDFKIAPRSSRDATLSRWLPAG